MQTLRFPNFNVTYFWKHSSELFCERSCAFFKRSFRKREEPVSPEHLSRYFLDSRRTMRNVNIPVFPKDLVSMKSGRGFHESCNAVYATAYRQELLKVNIRGVPKYTAEMVSSMHPPPLWEFTKLPWNIGVAVKIFRRDPNLSPNVADVMNDVSNILPLSRAALKRKKQWTLWKSASSIPNIMPICCDIGWCTTLHRAFY